MARNSIIKAIITADTSRLDRELGGAETRFGTFAMRAGAAVAGAAAVGAGAVAIARPLVEAASEQEEALSRMQTIFGDASGAVDAFAESSAEAFAVSRTDALNAAGDFAGFFDSLGGDELADLSTDLVSAASDFASFNDLTTDEALTKFRSALAGSSEVLRQYGIDTSAAAVEAKALEMGLGGPNRQLTEQEKNLARSAILLNENNTFMGDFARTSDSLANKQRQLQARFSDVQAELGEKLLPVALAIADAFLVLIDWVSGLVDALDEKGLQGVLDDVYDKMGKWGDILEEVVEAIRNKIEAVVKIFDGLLDFIQAVFTGDWSAAWDAIKQIFTGVWELMVAQVDLAWQTMRGIVTAIIDGVRLLWDWSFLSDFVGTAIDAVVDFFGGIPERIGGFITDVFDVASDIGEALKDGIVDGFRSAVGFASDLVSGLWTAFKDLFNTQVVDRINNAIPNSLGLGPFSVNLPDNPVPRLAKGGIVTGPTLALIGEAGPEAVIPLDRMGNMGGGPTIVRLEVDGRVLAEAVVAADRRAGGTLL